MVCERCGLATCDNNPCVIFPEIDFKCNFQSEGKVKDAIKTCEGKHVQQIAYSSYHDSLTQICFGCKMIRTSLKKDYANVATGEGGENGN